jgi:Flp pilus assembly protein TadG
VSVMRASQRMKSEGISVTLLGALLRKARRGILHCSRRALRENDGQALVETALSCVVLFGFVFCYIELCIAVYAHNMISECAREATRYAIVRGSTCQTGSGVSCTATADSITAYVMGRGWPNPGGTMNVYPTFPDGDQKPGSRVQVYITYTLPMIVPFIPAQALTMKSMSVMYIIQ